MSLNEYLLKVEKQYKFRIKALFPLDSEVMDLMEKALQKYRPSSISEPKKTILQTSPLGFTGVKQAEVYIVDVELTMPVTATNLQFDLKSIMGLPLQQDNLKVFSEDQLALETTTEPMAEDEDAEALLTDESYSELKQPKFENYYGADYNTRFLEAVKKAEEARKVAKKAGNLDATHPLSTWADQPENDSGQDVMPK